MEKRRRDVRQMNEALETLQGYQIESSIRSSGLKEDEDGDNAQDTDNDTNNVFMKEQWESNKI